MEQPELPIQIISKDILALIPKFDGDQNLLKLFIKKVEYVLSNFNGPNTDTQKTYEFHAVTSRIRGQAAALLSETEDIKTWEQLKEVLIQHFGDPRTEESLAIELENLKIKFEESYLEFYRRIQQTRSSLLSKVSALTDVESKADKRIIYNNLALNVFLYNLTEDLFRIVRSKSCNNLEDALKIVLEEVNFQKQYHARNKGEFKNIGLRHRTPWSAFNPAVPSSQNFRFGIPNSISSPYGSAPQSGFCSVFGSQPGGNKPSTAGSSAPPASSKPSLRFGPQTLDNALNVGNVGESLYGKTITQ